jgi:hypothetical protein
MLISSKHIPFVVVQFPSYGDAEFASHPTHPKPPLQQKVSSMFFEHEESIIPISQIKHCKTDGDFVTTITLLDGQVLASKGFYTAERLAAMASPFVQAQAGYFKIAEPDRGTIIDDSWPGVPIVAWRIVGDLHLAEPITPEMVSEVQHYAVLCPDGRVYSPSGGKSYASCAEFTKAMNSRSLPGKRDETEIHDKRLQH